MSKLIIFASVNVAMYLLVAFVTWDLAWLVHVGDLSALGRVVTLFWWFCFSVPAAILLLIKGEQNDD